MGQLYKLLVRGLTYLVQHGGHSVVEQQLDNGAIKLTVQVGGAV